MTDFYLPYQFIPVTGKVNREPTPKIPWSQIDVTSAQPARHDLWLQGTRSGRLLCRIHLDTPTFIGAHQSRGAPDQAAYVAPYQRHGDRAIPANSLRGMIAAVAEALSQSALRVLEDAHYSVRKPMRPENTAGGLAGPLSAIGRIQRRGDVWFIEPLTLPVLKHDGKDHFPVPEQWQNIFNGAFLDECLPAYIHRKFLSHHKPETGGDSGGKVWFARLNSQLHIPVTPRIPKKAGLHIKWHTALVGQEMEGEPTPEQQEGRKRGFLRVLGIEGRESQLPSGKKHELFIPEPSTPRPWISIPPPVLERFERLVLERARESNDRRRPAEDKAPKALDLPFFPKGYERYRPNRTQLAGLEPWHPTPGMLLYFDVEPTATGQPQVRELALSSIWRREVPGTAHDFFKAIDPDLLPWGTPGRTGLTPAESLFGVVEQDKQERIGKNLASRLRFSDALPQLLPHQERVACLDPVPLKALGSPKPPSPALYFHPQGQPGVYISKSRLNANDHRPNGRKVYLHHPPHQINGTGWQSRDAEQDNDKLKLICSPMEAGQDFWFHIDFDNLTNAELTLVRTALRPSPDFRHRLGLGKALGLGTVEVTCEALLLTDRRARYGTDLDVMSERFAKIYVPAGARPANWPPRYALKDANGSNLSNIDEFPVVDEHQTLIDQQTLGNLCAVGEPGRIDPGILVNTPLIELQVPRKQSRTELAKLESEQFRWFVLNDDDKGTHAQTLPVLPTGSTERLRPLRTWAKLEISAVQPSPQPLEKQALEAFCRGSGIEIHAFHFQKARRSQPSKAMVIVFGDAVDKFSRHLRRGAPSVPLLTVTVGK